MRELGFAVPRLSPDLFLKPNQNVQMGVPPLRIEILTTISGVAFESSYSRRALQPTEEMEISPIGLEDLKTNKKAAGRHKDLNDIENLP